MNVMSTQGGSSEALCLLNRSSVLDGQMYTLHRGSDIGAECEASTRYLGMDAMSLR